MDLDDRDTCFDFPAWATGCAGAYTLFNNYRGNAMERQRIMPMPAGPARPSTTWMAARGRTLLKSIMIFLGSLVALASYRYLFGSAGVPETILANRYFHGWVLVHATSSATALLLGPLQFMTSLRQNRPLVHRSIGAIYVSACLAGGLSALPLAIGTVTGPVATAGFVALGAIWMATTAVAVTSILSGNVAAHRRWMVRSFALTLAAVTLRLYLFVAGVLHIDFFLAYPVIAWACWLPNILLVEWYLRSGRSMRQRHLPAT